VVIDLVPLAGRAGREDDVGAGAVLDDVTNERTLVLFEKTTLVVEYRQYWNRKSVLRS
jgi:hypothetical protein